MGGKPISTFLVTAIVLWMVYLWRQGRLGKPGLLPRPELGGKPIQGPPPPGGWRSGTPPGGAA